MDARDPHSASLCLTFRALRLLAAWDKVVQGQVGVSLIKSMCSTEAPPCNAIKHVYSPPLHTFFFFPPSFHPFDKMPSRWSEHNSPGSLTAPGLQLWDREWGEVPAWLLKVIPAVFSPLTVLGRCTCLLISCGSGTWDRGRTGSYGRGPPKNRHLIPQLLVQPRRLSLSHSISGDGWAVWLEP